MLVTASASPLLSLIAASTRRAVPSAPLHLHASSHLVGFRTVKFQALCSNNLARQASTVAMPPTKSQKSAKASKAAKAILHPRSTLAAAKANHAQASDSASASAPDAAPRSGSPASSIKRAASNASLSSNTAKPLPSAPTSAAPAANASSLSTAAPLPSVLAPAIKDDILSMKKQLDQPKIVLPASLPPAIAVQSGGSTFVAPAPAPTSSTNSDGDASPYTIDDSAAASTGETAQDEAPPTVDSAPVTLGSEAISVPTSFETVSTDSQVKKGNEEFAAEVAAVLADSQPAPVVEPLADAIAAPTPVTAAIVDKASTLVPSAGSPPPVPTTPLTSTAPSLTRSISTTAAAAAKLATFTPPELTRLQHNTFVSRPTDASRLPIRSLDASVLPAPLRPIDRARGLKRTPSHVVIFGWMDAPIRLVAKYAQPYTVLFPNATVLIQLSDGKSYLAREQVRREQMQRVISEITAPARTQEKAGDVGDSTVTLIDHAQADGVEEGGFVIHSFSDGGAGNLAIFLDEMARRKGQRPRVHSLIMDSSPGKSNPRTGSYAFTMHLANRPRLRAVVQFLVYISLYLMKIWAKVTGQPSRGELMRKRLNSLRSWSWVTASRTGSTAVAEKETNFPPRMYMYTKADKLIPWQFVEEHARHLADVRKVQPALVQMENEGERERVLSTVKDGGDGAEAEYKVELRRWDTPAHCSIGRADFEGYWAGVMDFHLNVLRRE